MPAPIHASQAFVFLRRNYRISRNTRALWQFQQIATSSTNPIRIPTANDITQSSDELVLVSALDDRGEPISAPSYVTCTSTTRFSYFTTRYKFAFILDMTDSCASVSIDGGHIYLESLTNCLCILLYSLAQTFTLPGCELKFQPEIDISVYVYFPLHRTPSHQVLIHGYRLTWATLKTVCNDIINNLKEATELLHNVMSISQPFTAHSTSSTMDSDDNIHSHLNTIYSNSESSCAIINMLSYGITALQLMAEESTAALVVITDGILDVPNLSAFEVVMRQIRARIISCSFVQIGSNSPRQKSAKNNILNGSLASLGHVPNEELLKFISSSTFGSFIYFDVDHITGETTLLNRLFDHGFEILNVCKKFQEFQSELLSWGFHKAVGDNNIVMSKRTRNGSLSLEEDINRNNNKPRPTNFPISHKLINQTVLQTSLENVLSLRLREGYTVRQVQIHKDEIEVHLVLPWRYDIQIYYVARSVWPLEKSVRTEIRVHKEAPSYLLQEINQLSFNQGSKAANMMRNNLIRRYNDVIQTVSVTDRHLTLINTFSRNPSYYNVPETIKRGKAIFYLSHNDLQQSFLNVKDTELQSFADFWRPIVILDGSLWQRFMFTHNLTIILVNDLISNSLVSNNHLSQPNNYQQSIVSCRLAKTDFETCLSDFFSFVLLDGQAYIKFLTRDNNPVPYSFMLLRIMGQPPLLYLKFAFQAKATNVERHKILEDFRKSLITLRQRPRSRPGNSNDNARRQQTSTPVSSNSSQRSISSAATSISQRSQIPCCVVLNKNIERLMLRPDPFPYESLGIPKPDDDENQNKNRTELDSKRQALSKFFYIRSFIRSFESIKHTSNIPRRMADIILETLIRRRLQEGFHFVASYNNIYNFVLEVKMNTPKEDYRSDICRLKPEINFYPDERTRTCLIQYRIYPPEYIRSKDTSPAREHNSTSLRRSSSIHYEQPTSFYFLTQCWVEPQDGFVDTNCPELEFLNGCTYKQIVDKIGEVDRECFNTLVSFYFIKYLPEKSSFLPRVVSRAPRALTSDIIRVPFIQDTINIIRRSHQTYFDFSAFIDDYCKIRYDYINNNCILSQTSLNSTLLSILRQRLASKNYESKPQLFFECNDNNNAFTLSLLSRPSNIKYSRLPVGLKSLRSNPYLLYLLSYNEQQSTTAPLTDLERFLIDTMFPHWDFRVCAEIDDFAYITLLPKSERDLLLLNTDLTALMHDLIAYYSYHHKDNKVPIYYDCRSVMEGILDDVEQLVGTESPYSSLSSEKSHQKYNEEHTGKHSSKRRPRRDTVTSGDLLPTHTTHSVSGSSKSTTSSSPIPITHPSNQYFYQASSQPTSSGYRRIYSPLTVDTTNALQFDHSARRYSASAVVSPPLHHHHSLPGAPLLNLIPPTPKEMGLNDAFKKFHEQQWHIPIFLYACNKLSLASSLLSSNENQLKSFGTDAYIDYTKDDSDYTASLPSAATTIISQSFKSRKRENSRRHDEESSYPNDKLMEEMHDSLDYAFATAFYKNCLLGLTTHRSDVDYALNTIYQEHYEDIDLTPFLRAMCSHLSNYESNSLELDSACEPTNKHISSYLNDKLVEITSKFFHRVSTESDYFYFCTDEDGFRQSRNSVEIDDRIAHKDFPYSNNNGNTNSNGAQSTASGPYKFDDTTGFDNEIDNDDDDCDSNRTVHIHDNDDEDIELQITANRRRSDLSTSSLSNRSRELAIRGEILPLFICFICRIDVNGKDYYVQVKSIPLCISNLIQSGIATKIDYETLHISFGLICLTFGREDADSQIVSGSISANTPIFSHSYIPLKRFQDLNSIDAIESASTCTGTTLGGELMKNPLEKLRLSDAQKRAILACRKEIEWLLRDEQLSTYFTHCILDKKLIENVIEHVQSSVNIQKSNCLCRSIDLMFVLGIDKSMEAFRDELDTVRIRNKYILTKRGDYFVLLEPNGPFNPDMIPKRPKISSIASNDDQTSSTMEESSISESSISDDYDERRSSEDELDGYIKPSFWLFIERRQKTSTQVDTLEVKFYLYCGSSSDKRQNSTEPQGILDELVVEFNRICRRINQKLLLQELAASSCCNSLLVPSGENDDPNVDTDVPLLAANLVCAPGSFACEELWRHSFPLHIRLRPHLQAASTVKSLTVYHPGALIRELTTHFSSFAVHNRKNLFVYRGDPSYYMRFREDTLPIATTAAVDDSLVLSESNNTYNPIPSPQVNNQNNSKNRQRHDSGAFCIHVMIYGLEPSINDTAFESLKNNLMQSIVNRLEDEVVKELVNALYHHAMTRLNPEDVTFIRPIDSQPKYVFEYKISPLIHTNVFLHYFRRYVKTTKFHQPLLLPLLGKDPKDIIKDYRGQTLLVYNRTFANLIPRPGLSWIELHVLNTNNRPSPLSTEDLSDELSVQSLIDLTHIVELKSSSSTEGETTSENILRCNVWIRGSLGENDPVIISNTLLQSFTYALADYVTEYKLLPTLRHNQRHIGYEPLPSPRLTNNVKFTDEQNFVLDQNVQPVQTHSVETVPTTPTLPSRRRQESMQSSILSCSSIDEPKSLTVEHANRVTQWFHYLSTNHPKLPSVTYNTYALSNRILLMDLIHQFTYWLNDDKSIPNKHESLHGAILRCNEDQTLYVPLPSLDQIPSRLPGEKINLIVLYESTRLMNDVVFESNEPSNQTDLGDSMTSTSNTDISKKTFLCIAVNDKKLTMILYNATEELSKILINHFSNLINWSNKRLNLLNIIVTQKMGLFRDRSIHTNQHSEYSRHHTQHGATHKHSGKGDHVDLEQLVKGTIPPTTRNSYASWNVDLLYFNLVGSYPPLSNDSSQDLVHRHGVQLLQLRETKKTHMDRCAKLEEICTNWILRPKLTIQDDLLLQMKHRSRLLTVSVTTILFSRSARQFFQNNATLRNINGIGMDPSTPTSPSAAVENSQIYRMANKRKSVAIPVDHTPRRFGQSADENDYQNTQNSTARFEPNRLNNIEQHYVQITKTFIDQLSQHLQSTHKFHPITTKLNSRKIARSFYFPSPVELNFHRPDQNRRVTLLAELSSLNHVQTVLRFLQYDIVKIPNNQTASTGHFRTVPTDSCCVLEQTELDAFVYDFHLQTIFRCLTNLNDAQMFGPDFSVVSFLQEFYEYYQTAPIGSKTALFKTIIHHQTDNTKRSADVVLFKYVHQHAKAYNIQATQRNSEEYLFDCEQKEIYWLASRINSSSPSELTIVMYIIYTNLNPKQQSIPILAPSLSKNQPPSANNIRAAYSLKGASNNNQPRERTPTVSTPLPKSNVVAPTRTSSFIDEPVVSGNVPSERNVEYYRSKLISILHKASLSHRRESLWDKLMISRLENPVATRQEIMPIQPTEFQSLLDSCVEEEIVDLRTVTTLLQRVFNNKEQAERFNRFLRQRYGSQVYSINSSTINYLVILQCKAPQQCDSFLVLAYRTDQNTLKSYLVKHRKDIDCTIFVQTFTQRITYFLWECLV